MDTHPTSFPPSRSPASAPPPCPACRLELVGLPCDSRAFIFDGDFVDRGAWGLEVVLLLAAWKVAAPRRVWLVRGNHESTYCSWVYGFRKEVLAKFSSARDGEVGAVALPGYLTASFFLHPTESRGLSLLPD